MTTVYLSLSFSPSSANHEAAIYISSLLKFKALAHSSKVKNPLKL